MNVKTIIIIKQGIVSSVYSTLPSNNHDVEVLDLDQFGYESPDEEDALETRANKIYASNSFRATTSPTWRSSSE